MRTHTTQGLKQTRKIPPHNPISISHNTENNISEIIRTLVTPNTTIIYIMPRNDDFPTLLHHFQEQIKQIPYELSITNRSFRLLNNSTLRFYRCDHTLESKLMGLHITKAYIDGHLSLNAEDYKSLMANIASRIR